jgi:hypothetical protein
LKFDPAGLPLLRGYIDETGDRGFSEKSSPIFGVAVLLVAEEHDRELRDTVTRLRNDFGVTTVPLHWVKHCGPKDHDRRRHVARQLALVPSVQLIYVLVHKADVPTNSAMRGDHSLVYNYVARLAFERIALAARDWPGGRRRAIVKVSHVKGHDHPELLRYLQHLCPQQPGSAWVPWSLATSAVTIDSPARILGLQAADMYAGILNAAMSTDRYGHSDYDHLLTTAHQIRRAASGKVLRYGIKVLGDEDQLITAQPWWPLLNRNAAA